MLCPTSNVACGVELLDRTLGRLRDGEIDLGLDLLYGGLLDLRENLSATEWRRFARDVAIRHPLRAWIHDDPLTRRSFEKPRGYAGDAVLLDYIYGLNEPPEDAERGRYVYGYGMSRPAASAVRRRCEYLAETIDSVAAERGPGIRVMSIAAGHVREAQRSRALAEGHVSRFVALDSDPESCQEVSRTLPGVEVVNQPFTHLFRDRSETAQFDLVYSAGLFDYLEDRIARRLVDRMHRLARPGGRVVLTNFLPTVVDAGYMESYMGWDLIYRDEAEIAALADELPEETRRTALVRRDSQRAIGYLELQRPE